MKTRRILLVLLLLIVFTAIAGFKWARVIRVRTVDGGTLTDFEVLGRFSLTRLHGDSDLRVTPRVSERLQRYGFRLPRMRGTHVMTLLPIETEYCLISEQKGSAPEAVKRLMASIPWATGSWTGAHRTTFVAHGTHPLMHGSVYAVISRRFNKPGAQDRYLLTVSITEKGPNDLH